MIFKNRFVVNFLRIAATLVTFLLAGFVASELLFANEPPRVITVATWNVEWFYDDVTDNGENVFVTGDFNTDEDFGAETGGGEVAIVRGMTTESPDDDLLDAHQFLPEDRRSTHISGRQFDRVFYTGSLADNTPNRQDLVFNRVIVRRDLVVKGEIDRNHFDGFYEIPQKDRDVSDHYPLVTEFVFK